MIVKSSHPHRLRMFWKLLKMFWIVGMIISDLVFREKSPLLGEAEYHTLIKFGCDSNLIDWMVNWYRLIKKIYYKLEDILSGTARWTTSWSSCCRSWWPEWRGSAICSGDGGCENHDVVIKLTIGAHVNCHQGVPPRQPDHLLVNLHLLLKMRRCLLWSQHFCSLGVGNPLILCFAQ